MKEAIEDYLRSVELNYRKGSCYYNIGLLNTYTDDSVAIMYFSKALEIYSPTAQKEVSKEEIQYEIDECRKRLGK